MRMAVRMLSADVGWTWLCETVLKIDAGAPHPRVFPRLRCEREYQSPCSFGGSAGGMRAVSSCCLEECHAGHLRAVRSGGRGQGRDRGRGPQARDGPGGRVTVRRTYKTFYGVLRD